MARIRQDQQFKVRVQTLTYDWIGTVTAYKGTRYYVLFEGGGGWYDRDDCERLEEGDSK